jgi:hypothetical protein
VGFDLPIELRAAAEFTLGRRFSQEIHANSESHDPADYAEAVLLAKRAARRGYQIDRGEASKTFGQRIVEAVRSAIAQPGPERASAALALLDLTKKLGLSPALDRAQEAMLEARVRSGGRVVGLEALAAPLGLAPAPSQRDVAG